MVGVEAGVVVAPIVAAGEIPGAVGPDAPAVGSDSFSVVRVSSGDPRYHPIATINRADMIAAARIPAERAMLTSIASSHDLLKLRDRREIEEHDGVVVGVVVGETRSFDDAHVERAP